MEAQLGRRSSREAPAFRAPVEHYLVRVFAKDALPRSDEKSIEAARCELLHVRLVGQPASAHATRGPDLCLPSCVRAVSRHLVSGGEMPIGKSLIPAHQMRVVRCDVPREF